MTIKTELEALYRDGVLVAEYVVEWARKHPGSALHKSLEWNDDRAAQEYRIWQVRRLVALHIVSEDGAPQAISLRFDRLKDGGGYRRLDEVLANRDLREMALNEALADLETWQRRYQAIKDVAELVPVNRAIERAKRRRVLPGSKRIKPERRLSA